MPKGLLMMLGGPKYKPGEDDDEGDAPVKPKGLPGMGKRRFAKQALEAIANDDAAALDEALTAHYEACAAEEE